MAKSLEITLHIRSVKKWDLMARTVGIKVNILFTTFNATWTSNWIMWNALMIISGHLVVTMNPTAVSIMIKMSY